jgi:hypothetical protein
VLDDLSHKVRCDGQEVNLVGKTLGCLDGGDVGVDQDGVNTFFLERLDSLRTRVVEFSSLTDGKTTRSEDKDLPDGLLGTKGNVGSQLSTWHVDWHKLAGRCGVEHALDEHIEEELGITRTWCRFGVELDREVWLAAFACPDTLVTVVVGVCEQWFPAVGKSGDVNLVTVVLRGDVTSARGRAGTWQVHTTVTVLHLAGGGA